MDVGRGRSLLGVFKDQVGSQCGWSSGWGRERADRSSHHRLNQVGPHTRCTYEICKKYAAGGSSCSLLIGLPYVRLQPITANLVLTLSLLTNPTVLCMRQSTYGYEHIHLIHSFPGRSLSTCCKPRPLLGGGDTLGIKHIHSSCAKSQTGKEMGSKPSHGAW